MAACGLVSLRIGSNSQPNRLVMMMERDARILLHVYRTNVENTNVYINSVVFTDKIKTN